MNIIGLILVFSVHCIDVHVWYAYDIEDNSISQCELLSLSASFASVDDNWCNPVAVNDVAFGNVDHGN